MGPARLIYPTATVRVRSSLSCEPLGLRSARRAAAGAGENLTSRFTQHRQRRSIPNHRLRLLDRAGDCRSLAPGVSLLALPRPLVPSALEERDLFAEAERIAVRGAMDAVTGEPPSAPERLPMMTV